MTTTTLERTEGLSVLNQAMAVIKEKIEEKRGVFNVQMEVRRLCILKSDFIFSSQHFINRARSVVLRETLARDIEKLKKKKA